MARAPVAGSPEAVHQGTTWDHRAADLCMNHVLASPRQTETTLTEETFGQEDILFIVVLGDRRQQGWAEALTKTLHILMLYSYRLPVCLSHLSCGMRNMEETEGTTTQWSKVIIQKH